MSALKELAKNDGITALMQIMVPPDNPDAPPWEYNFDKCPEDMRGEVICAMARLDGFVIGLSGQDITMHTYAGDSKRGDHWFELIQEYHHAILWYLTGTDDKKSRTIH